MSPESAKTTWLLPHLLHDLLCIVSRTVVYVKESNCNSHFRAHRCDILRQVYLLTLNPLTLLDLCFSWLSQAWGQNSPPKNCSAKSDFNKICTMQLLRCIVHIQVVDKILPESVQYCSRFWTKYVQKKSLRTCSFQFFLMSGKIHSFIRCGKYHMHFFQSRHVFKKSQFHLANLSVRLSV